MTQPFDFSKSTDFCRLPNRLRLADVGSAMITTPRTPRFLGVCFGVAWGVGAITVRMGVRLGSWSIHDRDRLGCPPSQE